MVFEPTRPDLAWLGAWITGRALARGLPTPFPDRGGWRAEIGSDTEKRRWLFGGIGPDLLAVAAEIAQPGLNIRAFAESADLQTALPAGWRVGAPSWAMVSLAPPQAPHLPSGFQLDARTGRFSAHVAILSNTGALAASGHLGSGQQACVFDRIVTQPDFRRRGLGTAVMHALSQALPDSRTPQLLVATESGRALYARLGWREISPYASAGWVGPKSAH